MKLAKRGVPEEPELEAIPEDVFDDILKKHTLRKALRIQARARRWNSNKEPINANQIQTELNWWIKSAQQRAKREGNHKTIKDSLNLQPSPEGILKCRGRLQGRTPIYIPTGPF